MKKLVAGLLIVAGIALALWATVVAMAVRGGVGSIQGEGYLLYVPMALSPLCIIGGIALWRSARR